MRVGAQFRVQTNVSRFCETPSLFDILSLLPNLISFKVMDI